MDAYALFAELAEVENELKTLEDRKLAIRTSLHELVTANGGKLTLEGVGSAQITATGTRASYDTKAVDALMAAAAAAGDMHTANTLGNARKVSPTGGTLLVKLEK